MCYCSVCNSVMLLFVFVGCFTDILSIECDGLMFLQISKYYVIKLNENSHV